MNLIARCHAYHGRLRRSLPGGTGDFLLADVVPALVAAQNVTAAYTKAEDRGMFYESETGEALDVALDELRDALR